MASVPYSIIVPVWGLVHVARFLDWALPTWLSPRNLPELAARGPVEFILLTSRKDFDVIQRSPMGVLLRSHCFVKLAEIDDLIPGSVATVTLTLAFTRGVDLALSGGQHRRLIFLTEIFFSPMARSHQSQSDLIRGRPCFSAPVFGWPKSSQAIISFACVVPMA
jgi:hypothetical protein